MPTSKTYQVLSGYCPDEKCQAKLFFPYYDTSIECTACGQRYEQQALQNVEVVTNPRVVLQTIFANLLMGNLYPKKCTDLIKVSGLSNYHCKLISPFLTFYGMDRRTGKSRLLKDMNQGDTFDCAVLGDRAFVIDPEHINVVDYGRDISGSATYLSDTQKVIRVYNDGNEHLLPIHADGDGHCLVHAISRALVGRELFWHPLRMNLKNHFQKHLSTYKELFKEFIDKSEWQDIIDECDPDFQPPDGELLGLRNIHVFGLANVLKRPIILLDSLSGMQSSGDYSALFLPSLIEVSECRGKTGSLNKPLCIAWSSSGRNHYIPLVGIKNAPLPRLPRNIIPKPWGVSETLVDQYLEFDVQDCCTIGGDKCLQDSYILRLTAAMDEVFMAKHHVHPAIVADVHHYIYKRTGVVGAHLKEVLLATRKAVQEKRLFRCLNCDAVCEQPTLAEWFKKGGSFYTIAEQRYGKLNDKKTYSFPMHNVTCTYDAELDELVPDTNKTDLDSCTWCHSPDVRLVNSNGSVRFKNGDHTKTKATSSHCKCGFKHFWDGEEYDNIPQIIPVSLEWNRKVQTEEVPWFQNEGDPVRNSNAYDVADKLIQKHFPGVFGIEVLAQKVVEQILEQTKKPEETPVVDRVQQSKTRESSPSKIIITGYKTLHKEELTMSETERSVKQRIETNAPLAHRRTHERSQSANSVKLNASSKPVQTKQIGDKMHNLSQQKSMVSASPEKNLVAMNVIRVVTSDGKQIRLPIDSIKTYENLREQLEVKLGIPSSRQRILYGFPPVELCPPPEGQENTALPFHHGDKLTVEVLSDSHAKDDFPVQGSNDDSQSLFAADIAMEAEALKEKIWQHLRQDMENSNVQNLNAVITSLMLSASLNNQSLWTYAQTRPELFMRGGLFYRQVENDVGLNDGKHYTLPFLHDKRFYYNAEQDRLELCVEPHGHFAIQPGMDEVISSFTGSRSKQEGIWPHQLGSSLGSISSITSMGSSSSNLAGSSGVVMSKSKELLALHKPFQGQGYSLSGTKAPSSSASDDEKMDGVETDGDIGCDLDNIPNLNVPMMMRKAPGVSVLNPGMTNFINKNIERHQLLADTLKDIVSEDTSEITTSSAACSDATSDIAMIEGALLKPCDQMDCDSNIETAEQNECKLLVEDETVDTVMNLAQSETTEVTEHDQVV